MSATNIIDTAPLGALIRYTDGSPKPPARFTKKLAAWERSNGVGRLVKKEPPRSYPTWTAPASFTLHEGNFSSDGVILVTSRFAHEAAPALTRFANSSSQGFVNGIKAARQQIVARTDEDRADFLRKRGFSKAESGKIIEKVLMEEGRPPESIFDFVQGITRLARDKTQQDARLDMEGRAKKLLDRVG